MASIIKADNIQKVSDGSNIIKKCGSTITLGSCGATIALAAGATQTGFGQTYSAVEYCTTAKTSPFTAAAGTGYFVNTTCGAVTVTLPASPTAGDVVSFKDYAGQWNTNNLTLCNNGNKINGTCGTSDLNTQNQSVSLIYVDATKGWQDIQDSSAAVTGNSYITATGGTISCCGDYKIHTFTSDGTFCVSVGAGPLAVVDYLVIAGGGSGGADLSAGGGAGGYRESHCATTSGCYTASPLASATSLPVSVQTYPITVGGGGAGSPSPAGPTSTKNNGSNSIFSSITSAGGGFGGSYQGNTAGNPGGSGGGGNTAGFGSGNTPPVSPPQGNNGGTGGGSNPFYSGGGGGAGAVGGNGTAPNSGGDGGNGLATSITGSAVTSGGGGGAGQGYNAGSAGSGGSGGGGSGVNQYNPTPGNPGTVNTGGGGGGGGDDTGGGDGGSGIVIIRYKFQ
jgi:hypothetical protein